MKKMMLVLSMATNMWLLLSLLLPVGVRSANEVISVHGSGTNNPQNCYWHVMDQISQRTKIPTRLTYRAVGSGTGQEEFIGNITLPDNDFASGDIPLTNEQYTTLKQNGVDFIHLPVVMGAISFFHSVPTIAPYQLNLTSCLLARILRREIKDWNDEDIASINPNLDIPIVSLHSTLDIPQPFPITVARRVLGSSNTAGITEYLHKTCADHWPIELVGNKIEWDDDTKGCEGSKEMTDCILGTPGTIGYIDSGYGHTEGLQEVELRNADGYILSSKLAYKRGGILAAAADAGIPDSIDEDFSGVDFTNRPGRFTWPITAMTYIYVRKDLPSFIPDPRAQALLISFFKALYREEYIDECVEKFGFVYVTGALQEKALAGIDSLVISPDAPKFVFEEETQSRNGTGDFVISGKRKSYSEVEQDFVVERIEELESLIQTMKEKLEILTMGDSVAIADLDNNGEHAGGLQPVSSFSEFTSDDEKKMNTAFILAIVSCTLWFVTMGVLLAKMIF